MSGFQTYGIWHFRVSEIQTCPEYGHFLYFDQNIDRIFIPKNFSVSKARFLHEQKFELKCMQIFFVHKTKLTAMFWYMGTKLPCKFAFFHSVLLIRTTNFNQFYALEKFQTCLQYVVLQNSSSPDHNKDAALHSTVSV